MNNDNEIYPLTIVADRYGGCYSGAAFIAWNKDTVEVPEDSQGSDRTCSVFWANVNREEIGFGDTPDEAYLDLCAKLWKKARRSKIKYWVYEFDMTEEMSDTVNRVLEACEMTLDEFFAAAIQSALDDPEGTRKACQEMAENQENNLPINLVRLYPVYRDETEAQAKRRKLAEEAAQKRDALE